MKRLTTNNLQSIDISTFTIEELVTQIVERHLSFKPFSGGGISVLHGETQLGKTWLINEICKSIWNKNEQKIGLTTTLSQKAENAQLRQRISKFVKVIKLYDLDNMTTEELTTVFDNVLIIDEGDFGVSENGRLSRVIKKVLQPRFGMHIIIVGATNFSVVVSDMIRKELKAEANIKHFAILPKERDGRGYYGIRHMLKNNQIIDIEKNSLHINKKTGKIPSKVKDEIIKKHSVKSGLSTIRVSSRDEKDKTSITLADKVYENLKSDSRFDNFKIFKMYDTTQRDLLKIFEEAQHQSYHGNVIILHISGLSASISFDDDLKLNGKLRVAYETNQVASSSVQGTPGRFSGWYYSNITPDLTIFAHVDALQIYVDMWDGIYQEGKIFIDETGNKRLTTHANLTTKKQTIGIPMTVFKKGIEKSFSTLGLERDNYHQSKSSERKNFPTKKFDEIYNSKKLSNQIYDFNDLYHNTERYTNEDSRAYYVMHHDEKYICFNIDNSKKVEKRTDKITDKSFYNQY